VKGGFYLFLFSFWKRQVHAHPEEQDVNLVWPNLCIFWLLFIGLYRSWSWSLPNFVWMNISGYQNYMSSLLRDHILILNILFFNKLRQIIPEIRSERRVLLIFIFILKTTSTCTPVHANNLFYLFIYFF
jgi:hypothetical protein